MLDLSTSPWTTVRLVVRAGEVDLAAGLLWDGGVAGIEERGVSGDRRDDEALVELVAGTPGETVAAVLASIGGRWPTTVDAVADDDHGVLLDAWRAYARPWRAGGRLVVVPEWLDEPTWIGADDIVVRLDPGRAFGSGAHATTRLCLAELEDRVGAGDAVLDVGCGSGVLSVAAACLGAAHVEAIDIDVEAVRAAEVNAQGNAVGARVRASLTPLDEVEGRFAVVVANIGAATLVALAPALVARAAPGGTVVLSGVLADQVEAVGRACRDAGAAMVATAADGEWRALVFEVPST